MGVYVTSKKPVRWPFSPPFFPLCSSPSVTLQLRLVVFPFYQLKWIIQGSLCVPVKCFSSNEHSHRKLRWGEDDHECVCCRTQAGQLKQLSWHRHAHTSIGQWTDPFAFWFVSRGQRKASDSDVNVMWLKERLISFLWQQASNKLQNGYMTRLKNVSFETVDSNDILNSGVWGASLHQILNWIQVRLENVPLLLNNAEEGNRMETLKCHTVYGWADFPSLIKFTFSFKCHSCLN